MENNLLLLTDSYKFTHWKQYPKATQKVYSYFESRGGKFDATLFFGLQILLKKYLEGQVVTQEKIDEAEAIVAAHLGDKNLFNREGWEYILKRHEGRLPVRIKAVPEGTIVPTHNALMTIENTDVKCFWLTNYLETLLVQTWYPTTVATLSYSMKKLILDYLEQTGNPSLVDFKLHDFGFRGVSSVESAGIGGVAHLVNFKGTDTVEALRYAKYYYKEPMAGFSIPAAEHSTITSWGKQYEVDAFKNMLTQFPTGFVAVVSDSYNIYEACEQKWGTTLKDEVLNRKGTLVVRPDSGYPPEVVIKILDILGSKFGYTVNSKGFKVLDDHIRVIQGDGIDFEMTKTILEQMKLNGWSADNIAFGMGGALLQKLNRDTQKFAFKASSVIIDSVTYPVFKDPVTDSGKTSKKGRFKLTQNEEGNIITVPEGTQVSEDLLKTVFWDGALTNEESLDKIRERANNTLRKSELSVM